MTTPHGTWTIEPGSPITLQTHEFPTSLEVSAPVTGGQLHVAKSAVRLRIEMSLERLKASNFLMQGAARALVKRFDGDLLVFEAEGTASSHPWTVAGNAKAGQVDVPMSVEATPKPSDDPRQLLLGGSVTMNDISIPIPGLSGITSVTFSLDGTVGLRSA
ncbi:MAG: hypothetical protein ACKOYQ_02920 [Actinomycetota bacterium]